MTTDDAKTYLAKREIPRLFESLMTGLMYHRPGDHIKYLIDCLQKVHEKGQQDITWSSFVDIRRTSKTPLPPIDKRRPSSKGSRPTSRTRTPKEEHSPRQDLTAGSPLPAIPTVQKVELPECPIVVVMGAPGSNKASHVEKLLTRYPGWEHVNMGSLIKKEIQERGEGHTKWRMVRDLFSKGDAVPEDVIVEILADRLRQCSNAKGIVINGFPRSIVQLGDLDKLVGRLDCVFMLDCDEQLALDKLLRRGKETGNPEDSLSSVAQRLNYFKSNTLPCAKHIDDQGKLIVIDGDQGDERVEFDLGKAFDNLYLSKYGSQPLATEEPPVSAGPPPPAPTYKGKYETEDEQDGDTEASLFDGPVPEPPVIDVSDDGRKPDLPQCPIVFVAGGPGSGKGTQCQKIMERYPDFVHLSMGDILRDKISNEGTADEKWGMISQLLSKGEMAPEDETVELLKENLKKHPTAKAFLVEGFPRNKEQVEAFNKCIGGLNFVLLFDCEEYYMQNRLIKRGKESGRIDDNISAIAKKLHYYKHNTLPVLKYYDDCDKLVVLDADRDMEEMFFDLSKLLDYAFFGGDSGDKAPELPEDEKLATDAKRIKAAVTIQANYRGYMVRSGKWDSLQSIHTQQAMTDDDKLKQKEMETRTKESKSTNKTEHWYQNFYGSPPPSDEDSGTGRVGLDRNGAVTRIQAGYHGYKTRKESKVSLQNSGDKKTTEKENKKAPKQPTPEPAQEEVVEATITPQEGTTTGDNIANPDHSEKLDELAKQEPENQESENQEPQIQEETQETSS